MKCLADRLRRRQLRLRIVFVPWLVLSAASAAAGATNTTEEVTTKIIEEAERLASSNSRRAHQTDRRRTQAQEEIGRAIDLFREAQEQSEQAGNARLAARATLGLGAALLAAGRNQAGIVELERAVQLARLWGDDDLEIRGLTSLSPVYRERSAFSESSDADKRLIDLGRNREDRSAEISGWSGLCSAARRRGHFPEAVEAARHGVRVAETAAAAGRPVSAHREFAIRYCLGKSLMNVADYASGMLHLQAALETAKTGGLRGGSWHALHDIGEWYATHGDLHTADRYYQRAREGAATLSPDAEATTLGAIALLDEAQGHLKLALDRQTEAVQLAGTVGFERLLAENYTAMSRILFTLGRTEEAAAKLDLALETAQRLDQVIPIIGILLERGRQLGTLGRIAEAQAAYFDALAIARAQGLRGFEPAALTGLARLAQQEGNLDRARELYLESERAIDQIRSSITSVEQRRVFAPAMRETYVGLVDVLLQLADSQRSDAEYRGWLEQAFLVSERERSQSLRYELQDAALSASAGRANGRRHEVERQVVELQLRLATERLDRPGREDLLRQLDDAERELDLLERRLPGSAWSVPDRVGPLASTLRPNEAFVSYLIEERSWRAIVVAGGSLHAVSLPPLGELATQIDFFNSLLREGRGNEALVAGKVLAATFVAPILPLLPATVTSLIVSVTGGAAAVPIGVLPDPKRAGRPLLERVAVTYTPSLSLLAHLRARQPMMDSRTAPATLLALAFPGPTAESRRTIWRDQPVARLPWAADEARSIAGATRARTDMLLDHQASERNLKSRGLRDYRVIHLAAHALLDPDVPARSAILLGQGEGEDGFLQPREIYSLSLSGQLVVLSGCETAFGRSSGADGMHSLARAFLHAGAQTVVGSLWKIEDQAARDFMVAFYQELATGKDSGEALVAARLRISGADPYANAAAWAGIVLVGDPSFQPFPRKPMLAAMLNEPRRGILAAFAGIVIIGTLVGALRRRRGHRRNQDELV